MSFHEPNWWRRPSYITLILTPVAHLLYLLQKIRRKQQRKHPFHASAPVICIGNATAGGSGKTPIALFLAKHLIDKGLKVAFVTRGYKSRITQATQVDLEHHTARDVGDEAILLARLAPTFIGKDRKQTVKMADATFPDFILMDDGYQSDAVIKNFSLLVVNQASPLHNRRLFPAGPLREPLKEALARAHAVCWIGDFSHNTYSYLRAKTDILLPLKVTPVATLSPTQAYVAFAGIGIPKKFADTLRMMSLNIKHFFSFPDHHPYQERDLEMLLDAAKKHHARLLTTEKDAVRIENLSQYPIDILPITMESLDDNALTTLIDRLIKSTS